jgi:murein DD-endopeptidase MepM/ murein hydrolase activator NlpD
MIVGLVVCASALTAAACGSVFGGESPTPTATRIPPTPTPEPPDLTIFRDFSFPIEGACLPQSDQLMPNAARDYRSGIHEGVDFYGYDNCISVDTATEVLAAKDGTVLRVDSEYTDLTPEQLNSANATIEAGDPNSPDVLDLFRGRQVWIDHGDGIVTRYAHLSAVVPGLEVGQSVAAGTHIANVGDSGTPESISNPGAEVHLHFELRVGDSWLGAGLPPADTRALYENAFTPLP